MDHREQLKVHVTATSGCMCVVHVYERVHVHVHLLIRYCYSIVEKLTALVMYS